MITILGGVRINKNGEPSEALKNTIKQHGIKVPYNPETTEVSQKPDWLTERYEP